MAYLVNAEKLAEDETSVTYSYHGSGWDSGQSTGQFKIDKVTGEIFVSEEISSTDRIVERGIGAVLKCWQQDGNYPNAANWAS